MTTRSSVPRWVGLAKLQAEDGDLIGALARLPQAIELCRRSDEDEAAPTLLAAAVYHLQLGKMPEARAVIDCRRSHLRLGELQVRLAALEIGPVAPSTGPGPAPPGRAAGLPAHRPAGGSADGPPGGTVTLPTRTGDRRRPDFDPAAMSPALSSGSWLPAAYERVPAGRWRGRSWGHRSG
jgi:hypothetical protein